MSTKAEREFRARHLIMPVKIGEHIVDARVHLLRPEKDEITLHFEEEEARREVRAALNRFYYGQ